MYEFIKNDKELKITIHDKISKERIGKELLNSFKQSSDPFKFFDYMKETNFLEVIFDLYDKNLLTQGYDNAKNFMSSLEEFNLGLQ